MVVTFDPTAELEPLARLNRDLKAATATLSVREARYLVDLYYLTQEDRIRANNQVAALGKSEEPHAVIGWIHDQSATLERDIRTALARWSDIQLPGRWAKGIVGIGPVIAAGLLAHIDIAQAPTAGHIWRFAGLDPTTGWEKGKKRPWNASLKVICWKAGQSFMKVQNNEKDVYGHLYVRRKAREIERNEAGLFAEQAKKALDGKRYGADTTARKHYEAGKLPPAHIDARARRWAVKLFLAHLHTVMYYDRYGKMPPKPYALGILGHVDEIQVPQWPFEA